MSAHELLTSEQLSQLSDSLKPIAKERAPKILGDARDYLSATASAADLRQLEDARADVLACEARVVLLSGSEQAAAELSLGAAEANLSACLGIVRLSEDWAEIHARGELFKSIKKAAAAAAPALLKAGAEVVRLKMGA